jgi:transcriptional regulator with XRE-family HTH domain
MAKHGQFADWLAAELLKRRWTQNELGRKAHLSKSEVSRILNGKQPSASACKAIASAMGLPDYTVLICAGHITRPPDYDDQEQTVLVKFKRLNRVNRIEVERFIDLKLDLQGAYEK